MAAREAAAPELFVGGIHLTAKKKKKREAGLFVKRKGRGRKGGGKPASENDLDASQLSAAEPEPEPEPELEGFTFAGSAGSAPAFSVKPPPASPGGGGGGSGGGAAASGGSGDEVGSSDDELFFASRPASEADAKRIEMEAGLERFHAAVAAAFATLAAEGIAHLPMESLTLGKEISRGAFGIVRDAVAEIDGNMVEVAVKSLPAKRRSHEEALADFMNEVRMGWCASWKARAPQRRTSRVLRMFGIAYDFIKSGKRARLRIVMERVNCDGDMHDEIHAEDHWACLRDNGVDTGVSVRSSYWTTDGNDVWAYLMPIELKLRLALDLARSMRELERASVVHRDIKPSNMLLHVGQAESTEGLLLKLMDFGEAAAAAECATRSEVAGTPGYMAPEVEVEGSADAVSDVFSTGVTLLELWVGSIGPTFDAYEGADEVGEDGVRAMRREMLEVLAKVEKAEPEIGALLRRCCADERHRRPTPKQLVHAFKRLNGLRPGKSKARRRWQRAGQELAEQRRNRMGAF